MQQNYTPDVAKAVAAMAAQSWQKTAADGAAATATAETVIGGQGPAAGFKLDSVQFFPAAALTADDTNFATITVTKRTAGGSTVTIATATTKTSASGGTGNWTAWSPVTIPVSAGASVAAGDLVSVAITKSGTGVVVPQGQLEIFPALT